MTALISEVYEKLQTKKVLSQLQVLTFVRKFCNSKHKSISHFNIMINIIQRTNITSLKWFRPLFVQIKAQLQAWDNNIPKFQKSIKSQLNLVRLGRYFNQGNDFNKEILQRLCLVIQQKLLKYTIVNLNTSEQSFETTSSSIDKKCVDQQKLKLNFFSKVNQIFPEASMLVQTIRSLSFMQNMLKASKKSNQNTQQSVTQLQSSKDEDLINLMKDIFKIKKSGTESFEKKEEINKIFSDDQYFTVKDFVQQVTLIKYPKKQQDYVHELELIDIVSPVNTKCVGSISFAIKNKSIQRERSTLTHFQIFPSIEEISNQKKKFQQAVQRIIKKNRGVILFNCEDHFFQIFPNYEGIQQIQLEQKKQKLQEKIKNLMKQMSLKFNFQIDFINIKKINDSLKLGNISSFSNQKDHHGDSIYVQTNKYLTRLKITKEMDKTINQVRQIQN